ncbi:MAG: hypothetical protein KGD60_03155 [Candidatus Thorarchaeota archaeon]|nr:hypothetical protein [Candidatus Thorarchaeota archaeon]
MGPLEVRYVKPWWPNLIVKPRVRLTRPSFGMPTRPPDTVIFGIMFGAVLFVLGGNIYTLVRSPPAVAGSQSGAPILIAPGIDQQLGMEGIVASFIILVGVAGLGLIYYGSKYVFQPGYATRLMILGMIMAGVAFLIFSYLWNIKTGFL